MNKLIPVALATAAMAQNANAGEGQFLRGLFCNTKAQVEETLANIGQTRTLALAVALVNNPEIVCTFATEIQFMVQHPVVVDKRLHFGQQLTLYQALLVGVLIGDNPRPVSPPMVTFFIPMDPIPPHTIEDSV